MAELDFKNGPASQEMVDEGAAVLLWLESVNTPRLSINGEPSRPDNASIEEARETWGNFLSSLDDEDWKDGKHLGDCTGFPMTCHQCLVGDYRETARLLLDEVWSGDLLARLTPKPSEQPPAQEVTE